MKGEKYKQNYKEMKKIEVEIQEISSTYLYLHTH